MLIIVDQYITALMSYKIPCMPYNCSDVSINFHHLQCKLAYFLKTYMIMTYLLLKPI